MAMLQHSATSFLTSWRQTVSHRPRSVLLLFHSFSFVESLVNQKIIQAYCPARFKPYVLSAHPCVASIVSLLSCGLCHIFAIKGGNNKNKEFRSCVRNTNSFNYSIKHQRHVAPLKYARFDGRILGQPWFEFGAGNCQKKRGILIRISVIVTYIYFA